MGLAGLHLYDLIGMTSPEFKTGAGISLKPFLDARYPDRIPNADPGATWPYYRQMLGAMVLFGLGLLLVRDLPSRRRSRLPLYAEIGLLLIILLFASFMRFYLGQVYPYGLHYDESTNAMIGRDFIREWEPENQARLDAMREEIEGLKDQLAEKQALLESSEDSTEKQTLTQETNRLQSEIKGKTLHYESMEVPVFTTQGFGKATAHMYQIALAMKSFGTTIFSIRLPTMIAGVLGVLALYLLARLLLDAPAALLAAAFLAPFRWHVNFSRVAYDAIEAPLIITATAFFFFLAFKHKDETVSAPADAEPDVVQHRLWATWLWHLLKTAPIWLIAGYCMGLGIYSYKPMYLFPGILGCFLAVRFLLQKEMLRWNAVGLALFALAAFFSAKEMIDYRQSHPEAFSQRLNMVSIVRLEEPWSANWRRIQDNLQVTYRMFHVRGDVNPRHNHMFAPMVHPIVAVLFPLGMVWALVRWRSRLGLFSLGWFVAMLLPMVLSIEAPNTLRSICIIPVIALWAAIALRQVAIAVMTLAEDWLGKEQLTLKILGGLGWAAFAFVTVVYWRGEYNLYFKDQAPKKDPYIHFDAKFVDMARYVNTQQGKFFAVSDANNHNALLLLNKPGTWRNHLFLQQELPGRGAPDEDVLYVVMEPWNRPDKVRWIEWLYGPEVGKEEPTDPFGERIFTAFRVPADIKKKHQGFSVELSSGVGGATLETSFEPLRSLHFNPAELTLPAPFEMKGKAMWVVPEGQGGQYTFRVESPDRFQLLIDSAVVLDASNGAGNMSAQVEVLAGAHQVEFVFASEQYNQPTRVQYQPPSGASWLDLAGPLLHDRGMLPGGLRMKFWHGYRKWDSKPDYVWVDPFINMRWNPPYKFPLTFEWEGFLNISEDGKYVLIMEAWDYGLMELDGKPVLESAGGGNQKNRPLSIALDLAKGEHPIRIRYTDHVGGGEAMRVYWQLPGKPREIIPEQVLSY